MGIPARVSLVTLGVADVERATAFYEGLGWHLSSGSVKGEVSFFHTAGGLLGLYGADALAADVQRPPDRADGFRCVSLAINVESPEEVDAALRAASAAGATVIKPGQTVEWGGYSGYFSDPDGHIWEVAHNPFWPLNDQGLPILPP